MLCVNHKYSDYIVILFFLSKQGGKVMINNGIRRFNKDQIVSIEKSQQEFLRIIHPFLNNDKYNQECIELRPIVRDYSGTKYIRSLNLWRFDEEGINQHIDFLSKVNGQAICTYYSAFTFDYNKETFKENKEPYNKGMINNQNALYTTILPMDFDGISKDEHDNQLSILGNLGIETVSIFTGHGFQNLILLDSKCYELDIFKKFTYLLLSKGFLVDESIIDPARVLRLPHSFNCKEFDTKSTYFNNDPMAIPVKRLETTKVRYELKDIFKRISSLPTINRSYEKKYNEIAKSKIVNVNNDNSTIVSNTKVVGYTSIQEQYNMINFTDLPEGIKNMLMETPINYRNSVMMFLIPFFRNTLGLPLDRIIDTMKVWGNRCKPRLEESFIEEEVKRLYTYNNKAAAGKYTPELAQRFGYINFKEYSLFEIDNKVMIPNEFIEKYNVMDDGAIKIYLMMKLFEKIEGIKEWNIEDILRVSKISRETFFRNCKDLLSFGFIDKRKAVKKEGEKYLYYINKYYNKSLGFTLFNTATLRMMVYDTEDSLNNAEIKAYTYICKMINNNPTGTCWASQQTLGEYIGKDQSSLTRITTGLCKKKYILKDKHKGLDGYEHCLYTLVY